MISLERIAASQESFGVAFHHIGLFRLPENDVLFVAPEVSREMLRLKDGFADSRDPFGWSPHTTLLIDRPEAIREATAAALDGFAAFSGQVAALHLYEFWPTRHIVTVRLKPETE